MWERDRLVPWVHASFQLLEWNSRHFLFFEQLQANDRFPAAYVWVWELTFPHRERDSLQTMVRNSLTVPSHPCLSFHSLFVLRLPFKINSIPCSIPFSLPLFRPYTDLFHSMIPSVPFHSFRLFVSIPLSTHFSPFRSIYVVNYPVIPIRSIPPSRGLVHGRWVHKLRLFVYLPIGTDERMLKVWQATIMALFLRKELIDQARVKHAQRLEAFWL